MDLEFLKISSVVDGVEKFNLSWLTSIGLTIASPSLEIYFPFVIQFLLIVLSQIVAFGVDFIRLKILSQKSLTKVKITDKSVDLETDFDKQDDTL
ncbi:hypothetical protein [Kaistella sp.]|uniref:hypothetical protein n=1 Tax=Kaistella sp. TaxID=2782235 RepID=UPI003C5C9A01